MSPCTTAKCPKYPDAECVSNYCGGCNAEFFDGDKKVDCEADGVDPDPQCPGGEPVVNCFADPCLDKVCKAFPDAKCKANYCGGCKAEFYDLDENKVSCKGL